MTMYGYSQTELNHCKNLRIHLVNYIQHKDNNEEAEILLPDAYMNKKRAEKRAEDVNKADSNVTAAKFPLRLQAKDREGKEQTIYLVLFIDQPEDAPNASFMTPESFMTQEEAKQRVKDTNEQAKQDITAKYFPVDLYAHGTNMSGGAIGRAG